jgi:hypothetical protein
MPSWPPHNVDDFQDGMDETSAQGMWRKRDAGSVDGMQDWCALRCVLCTLP